jgi:tetratricopeptide (TPR) repeat protein
MSTEISPQFIASLANGLAYWQRLTENLDDACIIEIDPERHNLHEAVIWGLDLPQTCQLASNVALQTFFLAERKGYWQEWAEFFERALKQRHAIESHRQGRLLNRLGELYRYMRRLEEAVAVHKEAESLAQEQEDDLALAEARYRLCWDYLETRQYGEAEACCCFALKTFTHLGLRNDLLTNCYWALGSIARRRGHTAAAQEQLTHAANLARTTQQPTHRARIVNELAMAMQENKLYDEALVYYDEAAHILATTASERDKVIVQLNCGLLFFRQEKWIEAELAWRYALNSAYLRQSGEIQLQARLAHNLGNVLLKRGNLLEAEAQFCYSWQLRLELQDNLALANTVGGLAEVYAKQGKQDEAISLFEEALQLLAAYPDDSLAQRLRLEFEIQVQALQN